MTKPPEEGTIWEWRAFGLISETLAAKVRAYPIRGDIRNIHGEDIYLISPHSDQNIKLRRYAHGWVLKFKLLFESKTGPFELYIESAEFTYRFPVSRDNLKHAARLLGVALPVVAISIATLSEQDFVAALAQATPPVTETRVSKQRSQFEFENGWLELADVKFEKHEIQSVSVHSPDIAVVKEMIELLQPGEALEPMNYIEACRRWG